MKSDYTKSIELLCPVCGGKSFSYDDEDPNTKFTCAECKRVYTKDEIEKANEGLLNNHLQQMGEEVMKDTAKELENTLKKAFKGNKNISFKFR